jgi:putative CocE/NonD family hydrolase
VTNHGASGVQMTWRVPIPLRDGICLHATLYALKDQAPGPCIVALTPYIADHLHDRAMYFASRGLPFISVDVRGRGNSEGSCRPLIQEAADGFDVVEWLARQPYCNGKVAMYGGSYIGFAQWATAKECPPHLATIVPVAAPYAGIDVPMRNNIVPTYIVRWLTAIAGRARQPQIFADSAFWFGSYRRWHESGRPLKDVDGACGNPSPVFQEWLSHPELDAYWDSHNPTAEDYARLKIPILTITGAYDGDQPGALEHYKQHMRHAGPSARLQHYLIIGPWNHAGCAQPCLEFEGLKVGPASIIDMPQLHTEWYAWTLQGGPKPQFLQNNVAYYVMGAERWRYAATLEEVTARSTPLYLQSTVNPTDVFSSGSLTAEPSMDSQPAHYVYDPRDVSRAEFEVSMDEAMSLVDQRMIHASFGKELIFHSAPFEEDAEVTGFLKLVAWISIDRPDTDFRVWIYEIDVHGHSLQLAMDSRRARYRQSPREAVLIRTQAPLRYEFNHFTFVSRLIKKGSRLRLVFGPINSIHEQKNYNSGGVVSEESIEHAQPVKVKLFHDTAHPSALYIPLGCADSST